MTAIRRSSFAAATLALLALGACGDKKTDAQAKPAGMPPPEVSVVTVAPERVAISNELPGRIEATRSAEVRARVPGIVQKRLFTEGSDVKAGTVLFRIDPASLQAALSNVQATRARAEANLAQATLKVNRYRPLVQTNAISRQEFDDALAAQKQAQADLEAARASQQTASLNLGYATVTAPISGRIGRAQVTEGALVGQGEATPLATIQQLDPIYVNLTQSSSELLKLRQAMSAGKLKTLGRDQASVSLVTEDGTPYPQTGKLLFSDLAVDQSSGAITLRAEFPNPDRFLLPGMYVRARLEQAVNESAITVPQQAVQRDNNGASVMTVGADGKVAPRPIKTGSAQGDKWIVTDGLKQGDVVIVEGLQKVRPGAAVKPVPWKPAVAGTAAPVAAAAPANQK
nr:efflux RND transporter periplasmic adaptor subunit [uncultured Noviherbaspirillum sp.]